MRWIAATPLVALSFWISISQWVGVYSTRFPHADGTRRSSSIVPLFGGVFGAIGCAIAPNEHVQAIWWVPLLVDPGCALLLGFLIYSGAAYFLRRLTQR